MESESVVAVSAASREDVFQVAVRFRPLNERERRALVTTRDSEDEEPDDELLHIFSDRTFTFDEKAYTFDRVFDQTIDQTQLYRSMIGPLVERFVRQPHDVTIIAYGQTSSGKTHTIDGGSMEPSRDATSLPADTGLLPRTIFDVFSLLSAVTAEQQFRVEFSFYEIYCEKIVDLLVAGSGKPPDVQLFDDRKTGKVFMKNLTWERVRSAEQLMTRLQETRSKRHYAHTEMNANSSRSHTIFDLRLTPTRGGGGSYKNLRIVDLAGSERAARTKAVGVTFEEGKKINQSLMDLRSIIAQLSRHTGGGGGSGGKSSAPIVNHRASKLTRILYGSFKGRSRVVVLICCSPAADSRHETTGSLRFGCYAKKISLKLDDIKIAQQPTVRTVPDPATIDLTERMARMASEAEHRERKIAEYETEMQTLRLLLQNFERRNGDDSGGGGGGGDGGGRGCIDDNGSTGGSEQLDNKELDTTTVKNTIVDTASSEISAESLPLRQRTFRYSHQNQHTEAGKILSEVSIAKMHGRSIDDVPDVRLLLHDQCTQTDLDAYSLGGMMLLSSVQSQPAPLIDDSMSHEVRLYSTQLEKERRRNARYRVTIKELRRALDDKIYDNEHLEQELNAMRMLKNLLLKEL